VKGEQATAAMPLQSANTPQAEASTRGDRYL